MGFGEYQRDLVKAPWMQGPKARAFNGALGDAKQDALDELKAAVKARLPLDDAADDDLRLRWLGEQFALERYPGETGAQHLARLRRAFSAHAKAGTSAAVVEQLEAFSGGADVRVVEDWEWHGAEGEWPSRCWVVLGPDLGRLGWQPLRLGAWVLGSGQTLGSTATRAEIEAVVRIVKKWRDLGALLVSVIVCWPNAPTLGLHEGPFVLGGGLGPSGAGDAVTWRVAPLLGDDNLVLGAWTLGADYIS